MRVGIGVDAHALVEGVPLVLGGVEIEHERGLAGHSDGDVISHALIDAILGAAGLGDIGSFFPSDSRGGGGAPPLALPPAGFRTGPQPGPSAPQARSTARRAGPRDGPLS